MHTQARLHCLCLQLCRLPIQHEVKIGQRQQKGHWQEFDTLAQELQPYLQPVAQDHPDAWITVRKSAATVKQPDPAQPVAQDHPDAWITVRKSAATALQPDPAAAACETAEAMAQQPDRAAAKHLAATKGTASNDVPQLGVDMLQSSGLALQTAAMLKQARAAPALAPSKTAGRDDRHDHWREVPGVAQQQIAATHGANGRVHSVHSQQQWHHGLRQEHAVPEKPAQHQPAAATSIDHSHTSAQSAKAGQHEAGPVDSFGKTGRQLKVDNTHCNSRQLQSRAVGQSVESGPAGRMQLGDSDNQQHSRQQGHGNGQDTGSCQLRMPSHQELVGAGRMDLLHAVRSWGGSTAVADRLGILPNTRCATATPLTRIMQLGCIRNPMHPQAICACLCRLMPVWQFP